MQQKRSHKSRLVLLPVFAFLISTGASAAPPSPGGKAMGGPTPVIVAKVMKDHFVDQVEALGTLRANESITITSSVSDTVQKISFEDNQRVEKGAILVEMTSAEESANLAQQLSVVTEAKKQLERTKDLLKNHAAAQSGLDERQRAYDSAVAGLNALQSKLEDHLITAPFSGVLGLRNISVGALLQPGMKITTLDDDSKMKLDFTVPSLFLPGLKIGLPVIAKTNVYPGVEFKGEIASIDSEIDPVSRSITVRAILPNDDTKLKPGLLMTIDLLKDPRETLSVPEIALIPEGQKSSVLVVDNSKNPPVVKKVEVTVGSRRPGTVEILSGVKEGDYVVSHGTMTAQPGKPVKIVSEEKPGDQLEDMIKQNQPASGSETKKDQSKDQSKVEGK
jgi:membrane fusion protein (multidrug efflux system)